jgi:hypothetical protein
LASLREILLRFGVRFVRLTALIYMNWMDSAVGFKEWAIVCDSILRGETSLLFRKGGIAEGRDGFRFRHDRFFLFPTYFHEQIDRTRLPIERDLRTQEDRIIVSVFLEVEFTSWLRELGEVDALESLHVLKRSVLEERFQYDDQQGLHLAFFRAYRLSMSWEFPFHRSYGGCRSWVTLPQPPENLSFIPVLTEEEHAKRRQLCRSAGVCV